ncbi:MAG: hypothetical protein IJZ89_08210 [Clostridia bacterium]|nr:hypothetical protein [Clostridia bacterium]
MVILLLFCGCRAKQVSFCVVKNTDESINDGEHSRYVRLISLETDSKNAAKINEAISEKFTEVYNEYMNRETDISERLVIDYTYSENNGILSVTCIADIPNDEINPLLTASIYLDIESDRLYSSEEYSEILGIDINSVAEKVSESLKNEKKTDVLPTIDGIFHHNGDVIFILQVEVEDSTNPFTLFYNYTKDTFGQASGLAFSGFDALKTDAKELNFYGSTRPSVYPSKVTVAGNTVSFKNTIGNGEPVSWQNFFTCYEAGLYGELDISTVTVEEARFDVFSEEYNLSPQTKQKSVFASSVSAFGNTFTFEAPIELYGNSTTLAYMTNDCFFFSKSGQTVILTESGAVHFDNYAYPETENEQDEIKTQFFIEYDGKLSYIKRPRRYPVAYEDQCEYILRYCRGKDEMCREYGSVEISENGINLVPEKTVTAAEAYDLEGMLEYLYGSYDESTVNGRLFIPCKMSLEELLAYNAKRYK